MLCMMFFCAKLLKSFLINGFFQLLCFIKGLVLLQATLRIDPKSYKNAYISHPVCCLISCQILVNIYV